MKVTPDLLRRYANREATDAEIRLVEAWMGASEPEQEQHSALPDEQIRLKRIQNQLFGHTSDDVEKQETKPSWLSQNWWRLAACVAILIFAGLGFWKKQQYRQVGRIEGNQKQVRYITVVTKRGQRKELDLPDGTHITLNVASELRYPETFDDSVRQVFLTGEGFFSVAKNPEKPFIVKTAASVTRVLGTRFNLNAYPGEPLESVAVEEGRVSFGNPETVGAKILTVGQSAKHWRSGALTNATIGSDAFNWRRQIFAMHNERLADVCRRLEREFDVTIHIRDKALESLTVTGTYSQASLDKILNGLSYTSDFRYKINEGHVELF